MSDIHFGYTRLLLACLAHEGMDPTQVFGRDTLDGLLRQDPNTRHPVAEWSQLMDQAQAHVPDKAVALMMAAFVKPMDTGPIGFITMACATVRDAAEALAQFYPLLNSVYTLKVGMEDARLATRMLPLQDERAPHLELLTLGTMAWHNRWLARRDDLVFDACFSTAPPSDALLPHYRKTFGGTLRFDAGEATLLRPPGAESLTVSHGDHGVQEALRFELMKQLDALKTHASDTLIGRVEGLLKARLEQGEASLDEIAAEMDVSARTLQTRLDSIGMTFRELLDRTRHTLALAYLASPELPLVEVSHKLGFASQSSFNRAFMRWTDMAPGEWRRQRLQAGLPKPVR